MLRAVVRILSFWFSFLKNIVLLGLSRAPFIFPRTFRGLVGLGFQVLLFLLSGFGALGFLGSFMCLAI